MRPACAEARDTRLHLALQPTLGQPVPLTRLALAALPLWQARPGEALTVLAPDGQAFRARLLGAEECRWVLPFEQLAANPESPLQLEVCQALPAKERFELVLQKLTELGVTRILPFVSARSLTLAQRDAGQKKSHRWPEVVRRAARQCRRARLPELSPVLDWDDMLAAGRDAALRLMLYEGTSPARPLVPKAVAPTARVMLLIGPEGGFTPGEVAAAQAAGFAPVALGPRILRTETAAIVGTALVQQALGDLQLGIG